jgi:hypothetical protein
MNDELEGLIPDANSLTVSAPNIKPTDDVSKIALRRAKVRELMRMGYEVHQIVLVLQRGIKISTDEKIEVPVSDWVVKNDMDYIRQEDVSADIDLPGKRAEILDKLRFLYNQAVREYLNAKGAVKNSFLNTSLSILGKISELEGLKQPDITETNTNVTIETKLTKYSTEIHALGEEDRNVLVTAIRQILGKRNEGSAGDTGVLSDAPAIPAQASVDEGVSGEPELRRTTRRTKSVQ